MTTLPALLERVKAATRGRAACLGAPTTSVRTTEYMERCRECGTEVQWQLVDHSFFGFRAGCDRYRAALLSAQIERGDG